MKLGRQTALVVLLALLVAAAGCSSLAGIEGDSTSSTPPAPEGGTVATSAGDTPAGNADTKLIRIENINGGPAYYEFNATGPIKFAGGADPQGGEVDPDRVDGNSAVGTVKYQDVDSFTIPADAGVVQFVNYDDAKLNVTVGGNKIDIDSPKNPPQQDNRSSSGDGVKQKSSENNASSSNQQSTEMQVLRIKAPQGSTQRYEFAVTGDLERGSKFDAADEAVNPDSLNGNTASGSVGEGGADTYLIPKGESVVEFKNYGEGTLYVTLGGQPVEVDDVDQTYNDSTGPPQLNFDAEITSITPHQSSLTRGDSSAATDITIKNTGNIVHTFTVTVSAMDQTGSLYPPTDWISQTITLDPDEKGTVTLQTPVRSSWPTGTYGMRAIVWMGSDFGSQLDRETRERAFQVEEPVEPNVDATVQSFTPRQGSYVEGDTQHADVIVKNTGNVEHTFAVGYSVLTPSGEPRSNGEETTVTLAPGESQAVQVSWNVVDGAPTGTYGAVAAVWKSDSFNTRLDRMEKGNVFEVVENTGPAGDAEITSISTNGPQLTRGSSSAWANITIKNTGNVRKTFYVSFTPRTESGNPIEQQSANEPVTLDPGETGTVNLVANVFPEWGTGAFDARATVWDGDPTFGGDLTKLDRESQNGAYVVVEQGTPEPTSVDATITDFRPGTGTYYQTGTQFTSVTVKNTGNTEHTFVVGYSVIDPGGEGRSNGDERTVTLAPGESKTVEVAWTVVEAAPAGTYGAVAAVWQSDNFDTRLDKVERNDVFVVEET